MPGILFIHQSSELYGSDKALLLLASTFKQRGWQVMVVLQSHGPLVNELEKNNVKVIFAPVLKLSRSMFKPGNLLGLPGQALAAIKTIDLALAGKKPDLVYSNTLAVLTGLLYAWRKKIKHVWHVHEIVEHPQIVTRIYRKLIALKTNTQLIFNSNATRRFWDPQQQLKASVVWNGLSQPTEFISEAEKIKLRASMGAGPGDVLLALVGRINRLKGQQLLLEAFKNLLPKHNNIKLVFIGSAPPGQQAYVEQLEQKLDQYHLHDAVKILPFQSHIWPVWQAIDIAVVPSTEPESFGLVALEAMLCRKPVVAANIGGLAEVVADNETGFLFKAGHVFSLQEALECLILDEPKRSSMGSKGYQRATSLFTLEAYVNNIETICLEL